MGNVRVLFPVKEEPAPPDHDELCATLKAVEEGWVDRYSPLYCTCEYVREIRANERQQLKRAVQTRTSLLERRWASAITQSRRAYLLGLTAAVDWIEWERT